MSALSELQQPGVEVCYLLKVAGLPVHYYSNVAPSTVETWEDFDGAGLPSGTPTSIVYRQAVESVSGYSSDINPKGGVPEDHGVCQVVLKTGGDWTSDTTYDPLRVFGRVTSRGGGNVTRLITTLNHEKTTTQIDVENDVSGWTTPAIIHIGQEAIYVTGTAGTGTDVDPYRFTTATRGVNGTPIQEHLVDADLGVHPYVTEYRCFWESTRAEVWVAAVRPDGSTGEFVQLVNGFLDADPKVGKRGATVTLSIAPMTALLEGNLGVSTGSEIGLAQGWHLFDEERGSFVAYKARWQKGMALTFLTSAQSNIGSEALEGTADAVRVHGDVFYANTAIPDDHPRRGPLVPTTSNIEPMPPTGYTGNDFDVDSPALTHPTVTVLASSTVANAEVEEIRYSRLVASGAGSSLYTWPDGVLAQASQDLSPGTVDGTDGAWADLKILRFHEETGGPAIVGRLNCSMNLGPLDLVFSPNLFADAGDVRRLTVRETAWFGLPFKTPEDPTTPFPTEADSGVISIFDVWVRGEQLNAGNNQQNYTAYPIPEMPSAYYQTDEPWILADSPLPGTAPVLMRIDYTDTSGNQRVTYANVTASAAQTDGGGNTIGYKWTLSDYSARLLPSFGDFEGQPRVKMTPAVRWENATPSRVLLELLLSGSGDGINDATYDSLPHGLNLDSRHVDIASFQAMQLPEWRWTQSVKVGTETRTLVDPILRLLGYSMMMRLNESDGRLRLALAPVGPPTSEESRRAITAGQMVGGIEAVADEEIINFWKAKLNYDEASGEPRLILNYVDVPSQMAYGRSDAEDMELPGIFIPGDDIAASQATLRRWFGWMRAAFAEKRRSYRFVLPLKECRTLHAGDVITITHPDAVLYDGTKGLTGELVRIMALEFDERTNEVAVTVNWRDVNGAGWAPAMKVASVTDLDTVVVEANAFSSATHPLTGAAQTDAGFFAEGDGVSCVPRGNWSGRVQTTITDITGNSITTAANHGLSVGDTIRPDDYDNVSALLKGYAYLSDAGGTLGASSDEGKTYS